MQKQILVNILEDARFYPSPHNSQPIRMRHKEDGSVDVFYDLDCGLPAESYGVPFGYVCTGVFLKSFEIVANNYGYAVNENLQLRDMDFTASNRLHFLGNITFASQSVSEEARQKYSDFMRRQTSRIPYDNTLIDDQAIQKATDLAKTYGQTLHISSDEALVKQIIDINQRTLFYDLENDAVHNELMTWLRFSRTEAQQKADGLSAETMLISGGLLHFMIKHRGLWRIPVISSIIKTIYLNTMRGVRQVAWMTGPFKTLPDYVQAGKSFLDVWVLLTHHNIFLHPYGTVITNPMSHAQFVKLVGETEHEDIMAWMLFRLGYSQMPPKSFRRDVHQLLIED